MDHYCYTISDYDADDVVKRLKAAGLEPRRQDNRVYFDDPDGHNIELYVDVSDAWKQEPQRIAVLEPLEM